MSTIVLLDEVMERQYKRKRALGMDVSLPMTPVYPGFKETARVGTQSSRLYFAQQEWAIREDEADKNQRDLHLVRQMKVFDELIESTAVLDSSRVRNMLLDLKAENMAVLGVEKSDH